MRRLWLGLMFASFLPAQPLFDRYFDEYLWPYNPTYATQNGIHTYDKKLEDYSRAAVTKQIAILKRFATEFENAPASADRDIVLANIHARLLELEDIRMWQRNPDFYSSSITSSAFSLMSRTFAPPGVRLDAVIHRLKEMPKYLKTGRANLKDVPRIYTEVALEQIPGNIAFFENDLPLAFAAVKDRGLQSSFKSANAAVIRALREYERWMQTELLAKSTGDFRLGPTAYAKKLLYEEMVDTPLDRLREIGYANLRENQEQYKQVAEHFDPNRTPYRILKELETNHPPPDKLLDAFRDTLAGLQKFIVDKRIVTIPSTVQPIIEETPPFARALTFASMDPAGPFETQAKESYFNVTLPEKTWPADRIEDFMKGFHPGIILAVAIHETYPGHYVQLLWAQKPSLPGLNEKVRRVLGAASNVEGWAHYCEQMMLDEGFAGDDPRMRLGQLQDALLRNARYIVGLEMHRGNMTFEQGVAFFEKEGYQTHEVALRETKRGTSDPTYLYYTLGKLQILKLREDYRAKKGSAFSLLEFHDQLMQHGMAPIKVIRKEMLGDDSPTL